MKLNKSKKLSTAMLFLFLLFFSTESIFAITPGEWWRQVSKDYKLCFVSGFKNGRESGLAIRTTYSQKSSVELEKENMFIDRQNILEATEDNQIVHSLDSFYSDYANDKIPIIIAIEVIISRIQGKEESEIQKYILEHRKHFSEIEY